MVTGPLPCCALASSAIGGASGAAPRDFFFREAVAIWEKFGIMGRRFLTKEAAGMHWYDNAVFYHIYPLGLTGAPKRNEYGEVVHRLDTLLPWVAHIAALGCNALYLGPVFQSGSHGYDTTDYRTVERQGHPGHSGRGIQPRGPGLFRLS